MKAKLTFRHEDKVLRQDDTNWKDYPEVGDIREFGEHIYRVKELESATFLVETVQETEQQRQDRLKARAEGRPYVDEGRKVRIVPEGTEDVLRRSQSIVKTDKDGRIVASEPPRR